jgi:uncharacterized protein YqeY
MSLVEDVNAALTRAMKAQDQATLAPLRMLKSALVNRAVERGRDLNEAEAQQVVASLVKQRRDAIEQFEKGGRQDLADKEAAEIPVLQAYLPPAASDEEIDRAVTAAIVETGATSPGDMGRVMAAVMAKLAGRTADGRTVSALVRSRLTGE